MPHWRSCDGEWHGAGWSVHLVDQLSQRASPGLEIERPELLATLSLDLLREELAGPADAGLCGAVGHLQHLGDRRRGHLPKTRRANCGRSPLW